MTRFQAYSLFTTLVTFGLVILGGVVRVTDSGLGCPDWPRCHGSFIPPAETEIWIEWSHRLVASVTGLLILVLAVAAWRTQRERPVIIWAAGASLVILAVQVILGAITVQRELPPEIVATHLVTGLSLLATLIVITVASFLEPLQQSNVRVPGPTTAYTAVAMALVLSTMWLGAYMTESGANFACDGWPRCNGAWIPEFNRLVAIHWTHRLLAAVLGAALVAVLLKHRQVFRQPTILYVAVGALALYGAQVVIGAGNIWTDMSEATSILHLLVGTLIWSALVGLAVASFYSGEVSKIRQEAKAVRLPAPGATA
jgi:heme a synthase